MADYFAGSKYKQMLVPTPGRQMAFASSVFLGVKGVQLGLAIARSPMVLAQVIQKGTQVAAVYAAISPIWPWLSTGAFWSKTHGAHIGFGYEGQTVKLRNTPPAILVSMYMPGPSARWVGNLEVPTFGFGWGSHQLHPASIQVDTSMSRVGSFRPSLPSKVRRTSRPSAQKTRRAQGLVSRGRTKSGRERLTPWCRVHKRRHWCRFTRK